MAGVVLYDENERVALLSGGSTSTGTAPGTAVDLKKQ